MSGPVLGVENKEIKMTLSLEIPSGYGRDKYIISIVW